MRESGKLTIEQPAKGFDQFIAPWSKLMATTVQVRVDLGRGGPESIYRRLDTRDLRQLLVHVSGRMFDVLFRFLVANAEPES